MRVLACFLTGSSFSPWLRAAPLNCTTIAKSASESVLMTHFAASRMWLMRFFWLVEPDVSITITTSLGPDAAEAYLHQRHSHNKQNEGEDSVGISTTNWRALVTVSTIHDSGDQSSLSTAPLFGTGRVRASYGTALSLAYQGMPSQCRACSA